MSAVEVEVSPLRANPFVSVCVCVYNFFSLAVSSKVLDSTTIPYLDGTQSIETRW